MRIAHELTQFLGNFFSPKNSSPAGRNSSRTEETQSPSQISVKVETSGVTHDRVTFSNDAVAAATALASPTSLRQDLPPVLIPVQNSSAEPQPALSRDRAMVPVQSVAPVADSEQAPRQREAVRAEDRETPETRRLVRKAYGFPQDPANGQDLQYGKRIRIRA